MRGAGQLTEITPEHVSEFIAQFKPKVKCIEEVKGSTINKHLQVLSRMYTVAKKFKYETSENPVDRALHFADETEYRRKIVLSREKEEDLMREAAPHLRPIIQCMKLQGLRPGKEVLQLKVSDLDLKSEIPTLIIREENSKSGKEGIIPIRLKMRPIFEQLIAENSGRSEYIFNYQDPRKGGKYRNISTFRRSFREACRRAGIEGLQPRDLRRTCATRLHEAGVDPLIIKRFMRHSSSGITENVYIQSSLRLIKQSLDDVDKEPEQKPTSKPIWNRIRTRDDGEKNSTNTKCLFSMN